MKIYRILFFLIIASALLCLSCSKKAVVEEEVSAQTIIPGIDTRSDNIQTDSSLEIADINMNTVQILIDRDYAVYDVRNVNLDDDDVEEQIILASPLNEDRDVFRIYIADYFPQYDEYREIFSDIIGKNNLNIASIQTDDITGDHLKEVIVSGVDTKDQQVFEIFKLFPEKDSAQKKVRGIFSLAVDGDIEVINSERGNDYKIEILKGESFPLEVQRKNPDDDSILIVEKYKWNESGRIYELASSEKINRSSLSNENLLNFYRGTSDDYLTFLTGPWYKVKDLNGNPTHNMNEIFELLPSEKTLTFYSGDIQESFTWTENSEPVKYRHVLSFNDVRNNFLNSMYFSISIYIDAFDSIQVKIRGNQRWGGTYTQLTGNLQKALTDNSRENLLLSKMEIKGLYKTNLNSEIIFDSPEYLFKNEGVESRGIYTIFDLEGDTILEMKELSENGLTRKVNTYRMEYSEKADDLRIIRTITLVQGQLRARGIAPDDNRELHFEQIEKTNQDITDIQQ